ncbi:MAG TPA: respiratory nitrate reductase subunit gamma [Cyclobacteriaceae bacterium]|nr:respiratory nitrate reductase subunit gamma [Cytophagales bacterium]HRE68497.1 respiratory nitrate reductase subunit gamma [Cyclobacteriaceae bacterium]HRF34980.1 respiratory nitrate reductase subunit gamma [Cyclobacteriaceae bacterium]
MTILNTFFYIILPYLALFIFLLGTIYRYRNVKFQISSLSSEFLEGKKLFWGSVPFHWGMLFLFFGHLTAFLIPRSVLLWNSHPVRLLVLEVAAFAFGLSMLVGLINLIYRRWTQDRIRVVTSWMDHVVEILLVTQVFLGLWVALEYRWGSSWFASSLTPYLRSIFLLEPRMDAVVAMPLVIRLHIIGAYLIVMLFPFSRLMHALVAPLDYIWRPYQRVIWNWNKNKVRNPSNGWSVYRPKNN